MSYENLRYVPKSFITPQTQAIIATMLPPLERILLPKTKRELVLTWRRLARESGMTPAQFKQCTGFTDDDIRRLFNNGDITVEEADRTSQAFGYVLKSYPMGLRR